MAAFKLAKEAMKEATNPVAAFTYLNLESLCLSLYEPKLLS